MSDWEPTMNLKLFPKKAGYGQGWVMMQEWTRPGKGQSKWMSIQKFTQAEVDAIAVNSPSDSWIREEIIGNDVVWWRFWK